MSFPPDALATNKTALLKTLSDHPAHHNAMATAINDVVTELGSAPKGSSASLTVRLTGLSYDGATTVLDGVKSTGVVYANDATDCTAADTGALQVQGGAWVEKQFRSGGNIWSYGGLFANIAASNAVAEFFAESQGTLNFTAGTNGTAAEFNGAPSLSAFIGTGLDISFYFVVNGGTAGYFNKNEFAIHTGKKLLVNDTTDCTAADTGALQVQGGVWVEKQLRVGDTINQTNTTKILTNLVNIGAGFAYSLAFLESGVAKAYFNYVGSSFGNGRSQTIEFDISGSTRFGCYDAGASAYSFIVDTSAAYLKSGNYFYLRGDASTDGSVRMSSPASGVAKTEARKSGSWGAGIQMIGDKVRIVYDPATKEAGMQHKITNRTGGNSLKGNIVKTSGSYDDAVGLVQATAPYDAVGIIAESGIADGSEMWVWTTGAKCQVLMTDLDATTRGDWLQCSDSVNGRATSNAIPSPPNADSHFKEIGHALESNAGGTDQLVLIWFHTL